MHEYESTNTMPGVHEPESNPNFVVIGGGTGSFTVLNSLKQYVRGITSIVSMADSGGSTGVLRDELGVLPPGDVRQCLVALSREDRVRDLFNYRFPEGSSLAGHSFGNLFLSGIEHFTGNFSEAVAMAERFLQVDGKVLPMTLDNAALVLRDGDVEVVGEHLVLDAEIPIDSKPEISLRPGCTINPDAEAAILGADIVAIAPGNLYSSLAAALAVHGVQGALEKTKAKVVYVCNLVNKPHQTANFSVADYANEIERIIGSDVLDYVLYNIDEPSEQQLKQYAADGELPVIVDTAQLDAAHYAAVPGEFLSHSHVQPNKNDILMSTQNVKNGRSLIRHNGNAIARALMRIYFS